VSKLFNLLITLYTPKLFSLITPFQISLLSRISRFGAVGVAQVGEQLYSKHEAMSSNPSTAKKKKKVKVFQLKGPRSGSFRRKEWNFTSD
jgi:hypothetical protein